ncbi:MAG: pentapeptide repeat-containing protein [Cyanobacteria bacterium P01_D01_bin.44]
MVQSTTSPQSDPLETIDVVPAPTASDRPLLRRRLGAWLAEAGVLMASGLLPFGLGTVLVDRGPQVALNPALQVTQTALAKSIGRPRHQLRSTVSPVTNLLWTGAGVVPIAIAISQFYALTRTGQTGPKRWLGLRVVSFNATGLTQRQLLIREGSRWGLPLGATVGLIFLSGAQLPGVWLPGLLGLSFLAEGATARLNKDRRAWHDRLAGTRIVGTGNNDVALTYHVPPEDIFEPAPASEPSQIPTLNGVEEAELENDFLNAPKAPALEGGNLLFSEQEGGLTSIVLVPRRSNLPVRLPRWQPPRFDINRVALGGSLLLLLGAGVGTQLYTQQQLNQRSQVSQSNELFLSLVQTLIDAPADSPKQRTAILALAQLQDPRTIEYFTDLLAQANDPTVLSTLQQALVSQGLDSLPALQTLSQTLRSNLEMAASDTEQTKLRQRQQTVKRTIAQLLTLHEGDLAGQSLDKVDLSHHLDDPSFRFSLARLDAAGTQWRSAALVQANLQGTTFFTPGVDQQPGTYDDLISDLRDADLRQANLSQSNLQAAQLQRAKLVSANLSQSILTLADLNQGILTNARLIEADLSAAILSESNFVGADLTRANFEKANLVNAQLNRIEAAETQWQAAQLTNTQWLDADVNDADFSDAHLQQANFQGSSLKGADFSNAQLQNARFRNADLSDVTLTGANLDGVDFQGARLRGRGLFQRDSFISITPHDEETSGLKGVDFSRSVNLDPQQLTYICSQGGVHPSCQGFR